MSVFEKDENGWLDQDGRKGKILFLRTAFQLGETQDNQLEDKTQEYNKCSTRGMGHIPDNETEPNLFAIAANPQIRPEEFSKEKQKKSIEIAIEKIRKQAINSLDSVILSYLYKNYKEMNIDIKEISIQEAINLLEHNGYKVTE